MQNDGILKYVDHEDQGKPKTSIDATKVGLAEETALQDVEIGVSDYEIAATLRDMKDEYAKAMMVVPASMPAGPLLNAEETTEYDNWNGKR